MQFAVGFSTGGGIVLPPKMMGVVEPPVQRIIVLTGFGDESNLIAPSLSFGVTPPITVLPRLTILELCENIALLVGSLETTD